MSDPLVAPGEDPDADVDWFGHVIHVDGGPLHEPVPCPQCGAPFRKRDALARHLVADHEVELPRGGRTRAQSRRFEAWVRGLRFLPLWFVLPLNAGLTLLLVLAWGTDLTMYSLDDQLPVLKTWIVRTSMLPAILVLSFRTIDKRV